MTSADPVPDGRDRGESARSGESIPDDGSVPDDESIPGDEPIPDDGSVPDEPILRVEGLTKHYDTSEGFVDSLLGRGAKVRAVDDVSFELHAGETLGVVGESGCGKSTLGRAALRLVEPTAGTVTYRGEELTAMSSSELRDVRRDLQYVFQDPFSSLNPRLTVGDVVGEPLDVHDLASGEERDRRVRELLEEVGLKASHVHRYPHEFSGGQRQRIGIARALAVDPEVVVCDEPVSALDVSVQAQICNLLADLQAERDLAYVFVAHDLSVVEHVADRIAVMYLGEFVEVGPTRAVFEPPYHPYTEALLSAIPEPDPGWEGDQILLPGSVPSAIDPPDGCRFHTRCPHVIQPEHVDLDQDDWRALVDLLVRLRDADDLAAVTVTTGEDAQGESATLDDPAAADRATLDRLVREEFGLPDDLGDRRAADALEAAVSRLHDRDLQGARDALEDELASSCWTEPPELRDVAADHRIACHLYDDRFADARATSAPAGVERAGDGD